VLRDERGLKIGFLNSRREFSPLHPANSYTIETWTPYTDIDAQLLAYNAGIPAFQLDRATPAQLAAYVAAVLPFLSRQP
jgi:hypothetical protein